MRTHIQSLIYSQILLHANTNATRTRLFAAYILDSRNSSHLKTLLEVIKMGVQTFICVLNAACPFKCGALNIIY